MSRGVGVAARLGGRGGRLGGCGGVTLLPGHGLGRVGRDFLSLLHQGAKRAEPVHHAVHAHAALDALLLADLAPDGGAGVDADGSQEGEESVQAARLAHGLCVLAGGEAGEEVRHGAQSEVVEAAAQAVGPLAHDVDEGFRSRGG